MTKNSILTSETITGKICTIRNKKVMIDRDLARLYGVEVRTLNQAVKRNIKRFPEDFMFQLNKEESKILKSQIVTSSWGGARKELSAFTEQGIAMLSSVLKSDRAINVNIQIIRTFTKMREFLLTSEVLHRKIIEMEQKYDISIREIFIILEALFRKNEKTENEVGFKINK